MITSLRGNVIEKTPVGAVIDVGGVGYEVFIPLSTYEALPDNGQKVLILTRLVVREDAHQLYGFATAAEREIFDLLVSVSGIGPRLALTVLSGMSVEDFGRAVRERNEAALTVISGIGKKTAARLILELAEKMRGVALQVGMGKDGPGPAPHEDEQVIAALISLGLNRAEAVAKLAKSRSKLGASASVEELIKTTLRM